MKEIKKVLKQELQLNERLIELLKDLLIEKGEFRKYNKRFIWNYVNQYINSFNFDYHIPSLSDINEYVEACMQKHV